MAMARLYNENSVWNISESILRRKPTRSDILETESLINSFGIEIDEVPVFETLVQLLRWRKSLIDYYL